MPKVICLFLMFVFVCQSNAQNLGEKVVISASIGDTLQRSQREHLGLLPSVQGFRWAVFYLVQDSILNVKVHLEKRQGILMDTVIADYGDLASIHSQIVKIEGADPDSARILLKDGTIIGGTILGQTDSMAVVRTAYLGILRIATNQIEEIARLSATRSGRYFGLGKDPNITRAFLMPTASTLPAGTGYVADYELIFFTAAVGATDWLMVNGGTLLIPVPAKDMVFNYGFKARVYQTPKKVSLAIGLQMINGLGFDGSAGIAYAIASFGDQDGKVNIAIGNAFESSGTSSTLWGLSGDLRLTESVKLMAELWVLEHAKWSPLVIGVRFFGSRLSGDLGLLYPIGASLGSPIGIPVASITYSF